MSRPALIVTVALACYAALNLVLSLVVMAAWRVQGVWVSWGTAAQRAQRLVWLRAVPAGGAILLTALVVAPAFAMYEPDRESEQAGPVILALASAAMLQIVAACVVALRSIVRTHAAARTWLRSAVTLDVDPPIGVPAYTIESHEPVVALVGVIRPKLVAARRVVATCTADEMRAIVAHERGHLHARDNLKRWLMGSAPDALRWTPWHDQIVTAWHDAAEDAADDSAAGRFEQARVDLAALIVKIARLEPEPAWRAAAVSPFADRAGLERRVRRLLTAAAPSSRARLFWPAAAGAVIAVTGAVTSTGFHAIYEFVEAVVAFGR